MHNLFDAFMLGDFQRVELPADFVRGDVFSGFSGWWLFHSITDQSILESEFTRVQCLPEQFLCNTAEGIPGGVLET